MAAEGRNVDATLLAIGKDHGHYFVRKTFGKPTYCHCCCEKLWGLLSTDYQCEVCNFVCHEKCLRTVASFCSGVALQLIKNPVAHTWSEIGHIKKRYCCVCRKRTDDVSSVGCEDLAVSDCKEAATFVPNLDQASQPQHHHWREGNLSKESRCCVCRRVCSSPECLSGMRCEWCSRTAHANCYRQIPCECDFGALEKIMLPPNALTIPRTELPMEQLLSIHTLDAPTNTNASLSSPVRVAADDVSGSSVEDPKEKEDMEILRIFDGNSSLRGQNYRTASVAKTASTHQIRDAALRRFHIQEPPDLYYITQVINEAGDEEALDDPVPLRNVRRPEGRRAQIFLRYRDDAEKATVKLYGGWLRVPVTFCTLTVYKDTLVQDAVSEALTQFGLDGTTWTKYNLIEVSLDRGVAERTVNPQENMLQMIRNLRKDSLRRFHVVRFYLQEKEDPHGTRCDVFVGNLPVSLAQRQYERILLKLLGAKEKPFTAIGPIYFEYGSLVITFNTPKAATAAVLKLQYAVYEEKKLIVLCLPNVQWQMLPSEAEPLLVLVNVKSGGCQGVELIKSFRKLLNPFQVFDVLKGGPLVGLYVFRNVQKYKILACGGDGTIGWVLQCLDIAKQDAACFSPPCGIVPLGTGNDLSRVLRWGGGYRGEENPMDILKDVIEAEEIRLDRWAVVFHEEERSQPPTTSAAEPIPETEQTMNNPEDQTSMIIMNNYFGIGIDADVCLKFHMERDANPEKFSSRWINKSYYVRIGLEKVFYDRNCKELWKRIELEVDGKMIELPRIEGIIVLNLLSWGSGANPWGTAREESGFVKPTHYDGLLEVVGITDVTRLGMIQTKMLPGIRIAQGGSIRISTHEPLPVQVDGEPHIQPPGTITILKSALKAQMLRKPTWRRQRHPKETPPVAQVANAETEQVRQRFSVRKKFAHTRLGKSLTRFDKRRGSLGKSAKPTKKSSVPDNECHSAVEVDDFSSSSNRDPVL